MANAFQKEGPVITPENPEKPVKSDREIWAERLSKNGIVMVIQFILATIVLFLYGALTPLWHGDAIHALQTSFYVLSIGLALIIVYWQACGDRYKENKLFAISTVAILLHLGLIVLLHRNAGSFPPEWSIERIGLPYILAPLLVTVLLGARLGTFATLAVSLFGVFYVEPDQLVRAQYMVISLVTGMLTVYLTRDVRSRSQLLKAGFFVGLLVLVMNFIMGNILQQGEAFDFSDIIWKIGVSFSGSLFLAILIGGVLPVIENICKIITPISWLEMTDMNHKLLKRLQLEAPGTFHHCIVVAQLAEAAAESIGANGNYCRVVSYYHDIGKILHPQYFIENLADGEANPHDELTPTMSARVIIGHVADGVELGKEYHLNKPILDGIQQHHGKSLAFFFYHKALQYRQEKLERVELGLDKLDDVAEVVESNFRYQGPTPQNKEVAIVSLADIVESATRTLNKPTYDELVQMINDLLKGRIVEGHLDDSGLTLSDIKLIRDSFINTLKSMRHARISYPKDDKEEEEKKEAKPDARTGQDELADTEPQTGSLTDEIEKAQGEKLLKEQGAETVESIDEA